MGDGFRAEMFLHTIYDQFYGTWSEVMNPADGKHIPADIALRMVMEVKEAARNQSDYLGLKLPEEHLVDLERRACRDAMILPHVLVEEILS